MSLIRQVWLLLSATLLFAWAASVGVIVDSARNTLQTQLRLKNSDNAAALALVMSQQKGERTLMELVAAAQFDTGFYRRIVYTAADGTTGFRRDAAAGALHAPAWFARLLPIDAAPGVAQVSDGWRALGRVEVASQSAYAHDELWQASVRAALALAAVGVVAGLIAAAGVARIRRPLDAAMRQADSLQRGEYVMVAEPRVPELRRLTQAMNAMVRRLRGVFEAQAAQVEAMRVQASCDPLTGLANRAHFMARLDAALKRDDGPAAGGLVLLRVMALDALNRDLGRDATDRLIATIAQTLQVGAQRIDGAFVGRLNGGDFALALPEGGVADDTARAVIALLRAALRALEAPAAVVAGAVETRHGDALAAVMGAADLALANAESLGPFAVDSTQAASAPAWAGRGEREWRDRLRSALADGRLRLAEFAVVDQHGALLHLECPLRVQLEAGGAFETAAHWLPLALRSRLTSAVDERAVALALDAIAADGRPRGVNVAPASLADSGFAARLRARLLAAPAAAKDLWVEVGEGAAVEHFDLVRELAREVRTAGARFGLEHAGERLAGIERLLEAGLDYVKLDAALGHALAGDAARADFVRGLVAMLHGLGAQVVAEGVRDAADAQALWHCGVDGVTGPWVGAA